MDPSITRTFPCPSCDTLPHQPPSPLPQGTKQLLDLARSFNNLQAFVHVSSAYTNMNAKPGSLVEESIYRLSYGDQLVNDHELVQVGVL